MTNAGHDLPDEPLAPTGLVDALSADPAGPIKPGPSAPEPRPSHRSRTVLILAWIATAVVLVLGAYVAYQTAPGTGSYRLGRAFGAVLVPLLVVFVLRLVVVRLRHRPWRDAYRSGWLPLGTLLVLVLVLATSVSAAAPPAPADPNTAVRIAAPWTLDRDEAATLDQLETRLKSDATVRSVATRHVTGPNGASAFLVVTDSALRPDASTDELARGMGADRGIPTTTESIRDHQVVMADTGSVSVAAWVESPFLVAVYAADLDSARTIANAVLEVRN